MSPVKRASIYRAGTSAVTIAVVIAVCTVAVLAQSARLTILTINDVYEIAPVRGTGGLAELMTLLQAERARATHHLTTVNGDFLSPSLLSARFKGQQMIELFNMIGVDVVGFGNHEFDFGPGVTRRRIAASQFAWLGSNVTGPDGLPFGGAVATLTRQIGKLKVGLLGLLTPETAILSSPGPEVMFTPVVPAARAAVTTLQKAGAEVIIALTHLPIAADRDLARQVPDIHLILGGHDHNPITWYEGDTLIHKSGSDAHYLGRIDLYIDKRMTSQGPHVTIVPAWQMIPNHGVQPHPGVADKVAQYTTRLAEELDQSLGRSLTALDSRRTTVRTRESTMGNLIADALRHSLQADVALVNGGSIRGNRHYEAGVTLRHRDILRELPFGNVAVLLDMSGADLLATLEHSLSGLQQQAGRFLQVSGLHVVYNPRKPVGKRVVHVSVDGQKWEPAATYRVATNDYLLRGGDGYTSFARGKTLIHADSGPLLTTVVMEYITARGTVAPRLEARIRALAE